MDNEPFSVAMRINNSDCAPVGVHNSDPAQTPSGFAKNVSDDFRDTGAKDESK
jgi:hypothetical protein